MNTDQHTVTLPHPHRTGPVTTGTCACGWTITYSYGGHGDAADGAAEHIEQAGSYPIQMPELNGGITVMEGRSL